MYIEKNEFKKGALKTAKYTRRAIDNYQDKKAAEGAKRLPSSFIDEISYRKLHMLSSVYDSKTKAIIKGIDMLYEHVAKELDWSIDEWEKNEDANR